MNLELLVPDIGDFDQVEVIEVLVKQGDHLKKNDAVITLESDKSSVEVPSTIEGSIKDIIVKVGDKVSKGDVILSVAGSKNTNEKIIFTLVPSNFILSLKLKIGRLLPRADRSPTLSPLNINNFIKEYQKKFDKEFGVSLASIGKVNDLFYTSEVLELKK